MSNILLLLVSNHKGNLLGSEMLVLIFSWNLSNDSKGNYAWPSYQYLSRKSRYSLVVVKRVCKSLKNKGFITLVKGKHVGDLIKQSTHLLLTSLFLNFNL